MGRAETDVFVDMGAFESQPPRMQNCFSLERTSPVWIAAILTACAASADPVSMSPIGAAAGSGGGGGSSTGTGGTELSTTGAGGGPSDGCMVYLVGEHGSFYRFNPSTLEWHLVGALNCPTVAGPFSMAVDRDGNAWVLFTDNRIYRVDVMTAACSETDFEPGEPLSTFEAFGMGFTSNAPNSQEETLFASGWGALGKLDTSTLSISQVGAMPTANGRCELTGTGDGRLYGFYPLATPADIVEIDKTTGAAVSHAPQPMVSTDTGWAFAFWGGDFYMFTNPGGGGSRVDRYRPSTDTTTTLAVSSATTSWVRASRRARRFEPPE